MRSMRFMRIFIRHKISPRDISAVHGLKQRLVHNTARCVFLTTVITAVITAVITTVTVVFLTAVITVVLTILGLACRTRHFY